MGERKLLCLSSDVAKSLQPNPVWKKVVGFSGNHEEECGAVVEGGRGGGRLWVRGLSTKANVTFWDRVRSIWRQSGAGAVLNNSRCGVSAATRLGGPSAGLESSLLNQQPTSCQTARPRFLPTIPSGRDGHWGGNSWGPSEAAGWAPVELAPSHAKGGQLRHRQGCQRAASWSCPLTWRDQIPFSSGFFGAAGCIPGKAGKPGSQSSTKRDSWSVLVPECCRFRGQAPGEGKLLRPR